MAFKTDSSFLAKLTMGATANREAMEFLRKAGFEPVELERYSSSNKIWTTKVKRLRLPDLLCTRTGIRVEVRGKSKLEIKMSDSPKRRWDSGSRDEDLVALVPCRDHGDRIEVRGPPKFFAVGALRGSESTSKLGAAKSAAEGAERDRSWPSIVPTEGGTVRAVDTQKLVLEKASGKRQTYTLKGKHAYVQAGDAVAAGTTFLAGTPGSLVDVASLTKRTWDPYQDLQSRNPTDRYAAAKALGRSDKPAKARSAVEDALKHEEEKRTALELAGSATRLESEAGLEFLREAVFKPGPDDPKFKFLPMEAVFIMSEIASKETADVLQEIATGVDFRGNEVRQAAAWGLGKSGCRRYERLVPLLGDAEDNFEMHVVAGFGPDASASVIRQLIGVITAGGSARRLASASAALVLIGSETAARELLQAVQAESSPWIVATFGRLPQAALQGLTVPANVAAAVAAVRLLGPEQNWLAARAAASSFMFLLEQRL